MNIYICVCGEPVEVVKETIISAKKTVEAYVKIIGPNYAPRVIVLNDGRAAKKDNWQDLESLARELDVKHVARRIGGGFKAGNINNGLKVFKTIDPHNTLDIILDADFSPKEEFLTEIVKPFKDSSIDFAQSPQRYKNEKTWVAKAAAAHQIFFFDHICHSKGHDNALFLCGTNFAMRRSAFDEIGGMDTNFITEDYATSLELHLRGKKGVFIPKVLALGIAPSTLKAYFSQQQRWSKGSNDVTLSYLGKILFGPMTLRQKFHYMLSATYYLIGMRDLILMLAPLPYLFFGVSLIKANTMQYLLFIYGPLMIYNFILYLVLFKHPVKSLVLDISSFPVFVSSFLSSLLKKELSFIVTIKKYERENPFIVYKLQLFVAFLLVFGIIAGQARQTTNLGSSLNYFWASFDAIFLLFGFYLIIRENYNMSFIDKTAIAMRNVITTIVQIPFSILPRLGYIVLLLGFITIILSRTAFVDSLVSAASSSNEVEQVATFELLVPDRGVYYGYYQPELNSHPENPNSEKVIGEKTSLVMFYQDWSSENKFDTDFVAKLSEGNRIPVITWEPWDTGKGEEVSNEYSVKSIINGEHDEFIREWAKSAAAYRKPFFLRFAHEMNGDWYPWGKQAATSAEYVAMWRHVHDIFAAEGATNVLWVWAPNNTDEVGKTDSLLSYYPGDAYVDWVGFSSFNWGNTNAKTSWKTFRQLVNDTYLVLAKLNKPIMIAETSSVTSGGDKESWYRETLRTLPSYPKIKAVIFFDQSINGADFGLNEGQNFDSLVKENIIDNTYFLKNPMWKLVY